MAKKAPDNSEIVEHLQRWHAAGVPVKHLWRQNRSVVAAAYKQFGSWRKALEAAGFNSTVERWSRERVIRKLKQRRRTEATIESKLNAAALRYFGTMSEAYAAAGVKSRHSPRSHSDWTPESAIAEIRQRHRSGGRLSATHRDDPPLYAAAKRLHGSWSVALTAAGFAPEPVTYLSAQEVISRIVEREANCQPPTRIDQLDPVMRRSVIKHFGQWRIALREAGIDVVVPLRWSKRSVVLAIQARQQSGKPLSKTWREDKPLFRAAVRYFSNWEQAMRAAGFKPIPRERWSKRRVIERLQAWGERGGGTNIRDVDPNLSAAAARLFGSYDAALEAAGVEPSPRRWTDARVIAAIQDRYVAGHPGHVQGLGDLRLANAAKRRFGSWNAAVEAAGLAGRIAIQKPLRRWSRESVIQEIQAWHRSGRPLTQVSHQYQSLYCAAKTWFGTWRAALSAAGLQSERRQWSKEAVIDEILSRVRTGKTLDSGNPTNRNLAAVAHRHFGSWRKAIEAAGAHSCHRNRKGA